MSSKVLYSRHGLLVKGYAWNTKPYGIRLNIQILVVHVPLVLQISLTQYIYLGCNIVFYSADEMQAHSTRRGS